MLYGAGVHHLRGSARITALYGYFWEPMARTTIALSTYKLTVRYSHYLPSKCPTNALSSFFPTPDKVIREKVFDAVYRLTNPQVSPVSNLCQ
jgi:hypothetical protein